MVEPTVRIRTHFLPVPIGEAPVRVASVVCVPLTLAQDETLAESDCSWTP